MKILYVGAATCWLPDRIRRLDPCYTIASSMQEAKHKCIAHMIQLYPHGHSFDVVLAPVKDDTVIDAYLNLKEKT